MARTLRTPESRFAGLPGYAFAGHCVDDLDGYDGMRVHWLDEVPADAQCAFFFACTDSPPGAISIAA